jgi:hypothetical protein
MPSGVVQGAAEPLLVATALSAKLIVAKSGT